MGAVRRRVGRLVLELRHKLVAIIVCLGALLVPRTTLLPGLGPLTGETVAMLGTYILVAGGALRFWASLYIGGHKNQWVVHGCDRIAPKP